MAQYTKNDIKNLQKQGKTDWKRVEQQTEADIQKAALTDKNAPITPDYIANRFKPLNQIRRKLGL